LLALNAVPIPRGAAPDCRYFFWNGISSERAFKGNTERTLAAVFKVSKVERSNLRLYARRARRQVMPNAWWITTAATRPSHYRTHQLGWVVVVAWLEQAAMAMAKTCGLATPIQAPSAARWKRQSWNCAWDNLPGMPGWARGEAEAEAAETASQDKPVT